MNAQWRLFLAALGWVTQGVSPPQPGMTAAPHEASRFVPVVGICIGLLAAAVYWASAQLWPTSLAVVLAMLAAALPTVRWNGAGAVPGRAAPGERPARGALYWVFVLLIKYNALMALSAAAVPLPLPAFWGLGVIMIAAQAASRGLVVSVMAAESPTAAAPAAGVRVSTVDLSIALLIGLAPAALLGIPGLIGLVAAILMRLGLTASPLRQFKFTLHERLEIVQQLTELSFYLGALASWRYV